tara:strand:+ start:772 stop:1044 length:273 start_codon:yes stop_codon:yes gene_type:complete
MSHESGTHEQRKPAFHINDPNPLMGNRIIVTMNPLMARALCDLLDSVELGENESHIYAMKKHIRRYYHKLKEQRGGVEASEDVREVVLSE